MLDATREKMLKLSIFFEERGKSDFFYSRISMTSRENDLEDEGCYLSGESSNRPETRALSIQPKIHVTSVGTSNGTDHFGLVRPEYSGPALKVVHFDRSRRLRRSDPNVPFHLTKLLSPVPLFCILFTRTITKRAVTWVGSV